MDKDIVIDVKNLTKTYYLYSSHTDRVRETFHPFRKKYHHPFNALTNISFNVKKGDTLGIIGRNGSGKSTLLQIICGILQPTLGEVEVKGKVSALLELGAGFNPEFTGRQNVYIKSAILGFNRNQIEARFDDIVRFSEIEDFIEQPVKTYSSGMYVRLAFAVAIHVDPQILVVDEALSVGDAAFQYKCLRRIEEMQKNGTTVLLVTHSVGTLKRFCERAIWLHEGQIVDDSDSISVGDQYQDFIRKELSASFKENKNNSNHRKIKGSIGRITKARLFDKNGVKTSTFKTGENLYLEMEYELYTDFPDGVIIGVAINRNDNLYVCGINTGLDCFEVPSKKGVNVVFLKYNHLPLLAGKYYLSIGLADTKGIVIWDMDDFAKEFSVVSPYKGEGTVLLDHSWHLGNFTL